MNELASNETGIVLAPERTGSYAEQALGPYAPMNAFLSPDHICAGVDALRRLGRRRLAAAGVAARAAYLDERAAFIARATELREELAARRQGAELALRWAAAAAADDAATAANASVPAAPRGGGGGGSGGGGGGSDNDSSDGAASSSGAASDAVARVGHLVAQAAAAGLGLRPGVMGG